LECRGPGCANIHRGVAAGAHPGKRQLTQVNMGGKPRDILRAKGAPAAEPGLLDPSIADDEILAAMLEHPILVNRPIVVTPTGPIFRTSSRYSTSSLSTRPRSISTRPWILAIAGRGSMGERRLAIL
jgi:hypothetical protein